MSGVAGSLGVVAHPRMYDEDDPLLARVRDLCLALPETAEKESHGRPTFFAGRRVFAQFGIAGEDDTRLIVHPADGERPALLDHPRCSVPPYLGASGWLGFEVGERDDLPATDWAEMAELVEDSYRRVALVRMLRALDIPSG